MSDVENSEMRSLGEVLVSALNAIGNTEHIEAQEGDFIGEDGYLHCGKCGQRKEFRKSLPFRQTPLVVPCLCACRMAEIAERERQAQLQREREQVRELAAYSLTDERFKASTFDALEVVPDNEKAVRIARNYVAHFDEMYAASKGLIFYGSTGTGKTFLADCIANALMDEGVPVLVTSIVALTRGMGEELPNVLRRMKSARLLILDDFGAERFTDFKAEQIFDVIDTRYSSKKPMIITTNLPLNELKKDGDIRRQRVNERILEVCHPVKMDGTSWRKKMTKENYSAIAALLEGDGDVL